MEIEHILLGWEFLTQRSWRFIGAQLGRLELPSFQEASGWCCPWGRWTLGQDCPSWWTRRCRPAHPTLALSLFWCPIGFILCHLEPRLVPFLSHSRHSWVPASLPVSIQTWLLSPPRTALWFLSVCPLERLCPCIKISRLSPACCRALSCFCMILTEHRPFTLLTPPDPLSHS